MVTLTRYLPILSYSTDDMLSFLCRIVVAAVFGWIVGLERRKHGKEPGVKTHCLIAATACALMILSKYGFSDVGEIAGSRGADNSRMAAQVISGVSFLCAAAIFKSNDGVVRGITTAAGMWATAAIGLAVGSGMYSVAICLIVVILVAQLLTRKFHMSSDLSESSGFSGSYEIVLKNCDSPIKTVKRIFGDSEVVFTNISMCDDTFKVSIKVVDHCKRTPEDVFRICTSNPEVKSIAKR